MNNSLHHFITQLHGWGFGLVLLAGFPIALAVIGGMTARAAAPVSVREQRFTAAVLWALAAIAWLAALSGAYIIYPWYRAKPPAGATDLTAYPRSLLLSDPSTAWLHAVGMEWKEHVAWLAPIILTMAAGVFTTYGTGLTRQRAARNLVIGFLAAAFLSSATAAEFGLLLGARAPVRAAPPASQIIGMGK